MRNRGKQRTLVATGAVLKLGVMRHAGIERGAAMALSALAFACGSSSTGEKVSSLQEAAQPSPVVDVRRSLAITDQPLLANFTLERVLDQIITTSGVSGQTATALFQQWWDTQNPPPGLDGDPTAPNCTEELNGYPYTCRPAPAEGAQATCNPFESGSACAYIPIGLFMRFDLAPANGVHCGEYRVIFAKASGQLSANAQNRATLIFEASLANPHQQQGIRGCQRFVRAFADLSNEPKLDVRRQKLEQLYFDGYAEFDPVISYQNFGDNPLGSGQVRTNQFVQPEAPRIWNLREFKLTTDCSDGCKVRFVPVTNKVNPFGPLFDPASEHPNAPGFQSEFLTQVASLASADPNAIAMSTSDLYNSGQSLATGQSTETNYPANFGDGENAFRSAIQSELTAIGSALTPDEIVRRAQVNACAGCHRLSNGADLGGSIIWPASLGFTHVSERDDDLETVLGVTRFKISDALANLLLPHRKQVVENYLNDVPLPPMAPEQPIGGRRVH